MEIPLQVKDGALTYIFFILGRRNGRRNRPATREGKMFYILLTCVKHSAPIFECNFECKASRNHGLLRSTIWWQAETFSFSGFKFRFLMISQSKVINATILKLIKI